MGGHPAAQAFDMAESSHHRPALTISPAGAEAVPVVRELFVEYQRWLGYDLCFQGFADELAALPGCYAPPGGGLWLARSPTTVAGVVGMRGIDAEICELKRLWVRSPFRGRGLGKALSGRAIDAARAAGYQRMRLDTLARMTAARAIYRSLGFVEIEPYYPNPLDEVVYFELRL